MAKGLYTILALCDNFSFRGKKAFGLMPELNINASSRIKNRNL